MPIQTVASDLSDCAVRAQLDSILASPVFSRSPQLRRFLSFIVEQSLAGQGSRLKESVLAHELYGKGTDFDAGNDPVVRVDARRLRDKLREFYEGRSDPVVISLPKGSYVPVFEAGSGPRMALPEPHRITQRHAHKNLDWRSRAPLGDSDDSDRRTCTAQARRHSSPVASPGLVPRS